MSRQIITLSLFSFCHVVYTNCSAPGERHRDPALIQNYLTSTEYPIVEITPTPPIPIPTKEFTMLVAIFAKKGVVFQREARIRETKKKG